MNKDERVIEFQDLWRDYAPMEDDYLVIGNDPFLDYLNDNFFTSPASTKYHGAYEGGLYDHSKAVFLRLKELTEKNDLKWQRDESPFIVGMFHDLCKCDQYIANDHYVGDPITYSFNTNTLLKGHGSKSVIILSQFINLTEEEMLCIRYHMGAYEKEEWTEFDAAIRKYPNVLWTHMADQLASKIDNV